MRDGILCYPLAEVGVVARDEQSRGLCVASVVGGLLDASASLFEGSAQERATVQAAPMWPRSEPKEIRVTEPSQTPAPAAPAPAAPVAAAPPAASPAPAAATAAAPAAGERIGIEDFLKVELRVAKVREASAMPKSKKLIRLLVDAGDPEPRTILAGIAEGYQPEQLVGKTIVIVANLKPRPMMGLQSNGMVLAASGPGQPPILVAADESLPAGTRVG